MRLTYTDLKNTFLDGTQNTGSTNSELLSFFQRQLDRRYQTALAVIMGYQTEIAKQASTVVGQQYYHMPPGLIQIESATVTIGNIAYPVTVINSAREWQKINETLVSTTAIPAFIHPRRDDFGIWPIPQGVYTITINYDLRDRKMTNDDYTSGTIQVTNASQAVVGTTTSWTSAMVGRWFVVNSNQYWYKVAAVADATHLTLETAYLGSSSSGEAYRIGETPEMPEEGHDLLAWGTVSDFFAMKRKDVKTATWHNNVFWTGDGQNDRREGKFEAGILGIAQRYQKRMNVGVVYRKRTTEQANQRFAETITA